MPTHPKLKPGYQAPEIPHGYDQLCAIYHPSGHVVIDFINIEKRDFAYADDQGVLFEWPWVEGFRPEPKDWKAIEFYPLW